MQFNHAPAAVTAVFDDPNLISAAGLVPVMRLAEAAGLTALADEHLSVPTDKGANAGGKVTALVAGMIAGADSIDDMNVLRHGGMRRLFDRVYAPSTLGSFLRTCRFGHVRQLDAVACRFLQKLGVRAPILAVPTEDTFVFLDIDDTVIEVNSPRKQGAGIGYSGTRGLNALIGTASTTGSAPVIVAQRLRHGKVNSPRGADRFIGDALATTTRLNPGTPAGRVLVRADSAFYGHPAISRAIRAGADVSVTVKRNPAVMAAIEKMDQHQWETIVYPNPITDPDTGEVIRGAEVAETPFTAFTGKPKHQQITGRLIVRRVRNGDTQPALFPTWRYHAFFTTVPAPTHDTVTADRIHRAHAIIEQVHADLKNGPLAHLPSSNFWANSAWLVLAVIAYNLTHAAGRLADPTGPLATATSSTIRRTLIHVAARLASSARKLVLHLPTAWPWAIPWHTLFAATGPPRPATT